MGLWGMPWKTLRSIFSMLWIISKTLIASRTTKELSQATAAYRQTQRALRQTFSKTLTLSPRCNLLKNFVESSVKGTTVKQQACDIFDQISQKFLAKAVMSVPRVN